MQINNSTEIIILGVDPGTSILGYSIISSNKNSIKILNHNVLHLKKMKNHFDKLGCIYETLHLIINEYHPEVLAIESPFFGKNIQSMLKLGRAQGAAMMAAINQHLEIVEYSPRKIKQSITGKGNASKQQVAYMLKSILQLKEMPMYFDETDALAAAVCHHNSTKNITVKSAVFKNWSDYIQSNPKKISGI